MKLFKNGLFYFTVLLVVLSIFTEETEARRRILRGRKTVTRRYYRGLAIPAWAIIVLVGIGNIIIGACLYLIMRKVVLSGTVTSTNSYAPALMDEA